MGGETELLRWIGLKNEKAIYDLEEDRQNCLRKKKNKDDLKEHEEYMVEQGFTIEYNKVTLPNGENYEL